jgi:putative hemolysin
MFAETPMALVEIGIILVLILVNGFFAMSELAVVSSRRARLQAMEAAGVRGAAAARRLTEHPGRFLSSVQIGITLVGVLAGAYGGATVARRLAPTLTDLGLRPEIASSVAFGAVVFAVTYLSLIMGELVPKQIALANPERMACRIANIMHAVAKIAAPAVWLLETSSRLLLRALGREPPKQREVSEEEIRALVAEAAIAGVVEPEERVMISRVMRLGDLSVRSAMTPRHEVDWIDLDRTPEEQLAVLMASPHSRIPLGRGAVDEVEAVVHVRDVMQALAAGGSVDLEHLGRIPATLHDGNDLLTALEAIRKAPIDMAFVIDEYGTFEGLVTSADLLEAIAGELHPPGSEEEPDAVRREDGSWLLDGGKSIADTAELLSLEVPEQRDYHTLAGFVLDHLERLPRSGDSFEADGWCFEVVDMDGRRIDKVLARRVAAPSSPLRSNPGEGPGAAGSPRA